MFNQAIIYYPKDDKIFSQIRKDIAVFRCDAAIDYIRSLNLNDNQINPLVSSIEEEIAERNKNSA